MYILIPHFPPYRPLSTFDADLYEMTQIEKLQMKKISRRDDLGANLPFMSQLNNPCLIDRARCSDQ